ncbi:hypothetical protein AB0895_20405 [Streptomyces globisporus]|uniref:DUF7848 domain-containing protein n=1 Tax=Streptomyces globisporus TaxID=1908 RepID=UPI00345F802F
MGTVTPRSVLRYETWTLQPDREPDAETVLYAMQCAVDGETSPTSEDFAEPQDSVRDAAPPSCPTEPRSPAPPATAPGRPGRCLGSPSPAMCGR